MRKIPVPSPREVRLAFIVGAICAFAITTAIVWGIVHRVSQSDGVLHVAVANADQVQRLSEQLDAQGEQLDALKEQAAKDARIAARERRSLRQQNRNLLAYLKANGIAVPEAFASPATPRTPGGSSGPKAHPPSGASSPSSPGSPGHTGSTPGTPRPSTSPTPGLADPLCEVLHLDPCPLT